MGLDAVAESLSHRARIEENRPRVARRVGREAGMGSAATGGTASRYQATRPGLRRSTHFLHWNEKGKPLPRAPYRNHLTTHSKNKNGPPALWEWPFQFPRP